MSEKKTPRKGDRVRVVVEGEYERYEGEDNCACYYTKNDRRLVSVEVLAPTWRPGDVVVIDYNSFYRTLLRDNSGGWHCESAPNTGYCDDARLNEKRQRWNVTHVLRDGQPVK